MNLDKRLLGQTKQVRIYLALTVGMGLLAAVATVLQALYLSRVVALVFLQGRTLGEVWPLLWTLLLVIVARSGVAWVREVTAHRAAGRIKAHLRERLFARILALGPAHARGERTGELANTAVQGIEALDAYFSQYLPNLALAALVPLTVLAFVFPLDILSGLVFLLTAPLIPIFMILIGKLAEALTRKQWDSLGWMSAHFLDVLQGLATLKQFGRSRAQIQIIARISDRFRHTTMGVLRVAFLSALVLELVASISTAVVAVEVGLRLLYATISFEQAFFVLILAPEFYLPLRALGTSFHAGMSGVAAAERVFGVLAADGGTGGVGDGEKVPMSPRPPVSLSRSRLAIHFDEVHYAYEGGRRPALRGVSFRVGHGQRVALVGPSGSGKSTVAHLLLRFIEPDRGMILVDGTPLSELSPEGWRDLVAWVPQDPYLFHATVAENIRLARPEASMEQVEEAARLAHAHDFVQMLPRGYDTVIGERGSRLSGGQAQRIALARAFLKDAPLLILDEAASNLDVEQEALLRESLDRLMQGRTTLIIAHRLGTVYEADQIVVLEDGRVVEAGAHVTLLQQRGLYHRLVAAFSDERSAISGQHSAFSSQRHQSSSATPGPHPDHLPGRECWGEMQGGKNIAQALSPGATIWRLLRLLAPFRGWVALSVLLGFATVGSGIGLMAVAAFVIASAALHPSVAELALPIVGVRFFGISRGVFRYLERYVSHQVTFRLLARLRVWFYEAIEPLAPARLMQYRSGDLLSRVVADIETLEHFFVRVVAPPVVALLVGLLIWMVLGIYDPSLAYTLLSFLLLSGIGVPLLTHLLGKGPGRKMAKLRSDLNVQLVDGIQGMADLIAYGQGGRQLDRVRALNRQMAGAQQQMARVTGLHGALGTLLANLGMWTVLAMAIPLVSGAGMEGIYLPVLAMVALASFEAVLPLPLAFQHLETSLNAARRLFDIVDAHPHPSLSPSPRPPVPSPAPTLVVDNLRFRYAPDEPLVLDGVSFELPRGKHLAIVGPSGAGKSTLVHLLLRFWDYEGGRIILGGRELGEYDPEEVRRLLAVVSQRTHLFNGTIRENLLIARPDANEEELVRAAGIAQLHPFVQALARGYDTRIGEQGLRLSGGERQRLAVARALLKDAPILIMDEATANLDSATEREMVQAVHTLMEGRTTLTITHRLVGLEAADEILVLHAGRVVERGRHRQLLQSDGLYSRMRGLQRQLLPDHASLYL